MNIVTKIVKAELPQFMNDLSGETEFTIAFTKANGEERVYEGCKMHVPYINESKGDDETPKRKGLSNKDQIARGNVMFWVPEKGYRIAKAENVKYVEIDGNRIETV